MWRLAFGLMFISWLGCAQEEGPEPLPSGEVGPEGGFIQGADGLATLSLPVGALAERVPLAITRLEVVSTAAGVLPETAIEIGPGSAELAKRATVTLRYRREDMPEAEAAWLRVVELKPDGTLGQTIFVDHDKERRQVSCQLSRLGRYALADLRRLDVARGESTERANQVDVLFVVDTSKSMLLEQEQLALNMPRLLKKLDAAGLDYRIGVISPDLGAGPHTFVETCSLPGGLGGRLQARPSGDGCSRPTDPWIAKHGEQTNVPGDDVAGAFACIARLGSGGCGFEQPLEAMLEALDPRTNPGFLREDAALALVFLTDEDDCSARDPRLYDLRDLSLGPANWRCFDQAASCSNPAGGSAREPGPREDCVPRQDGLLQPIQRYVDAVRAAKPSGNVLVSVIAGPPTPVVAGLRGGVGAGGAPGLDLAPSCSFQTEAWRAEAFPAIRLSAFAAQFGAERSAFTNICTADLSPALDRLGELVVDEPDPRWCLPHEPLDLDPESAALEGACRVTHGSEELPSCDVAPDQTCYRLSRNPGCPTSATQLELDQAAKVRTASEIAVTCVLRPL